MKYSNDLTLAASDSDVQIAFRTKRIMTEQVPPNTVVNHLPTELQPVETIVVSIPTALKLHELLSQLLKEHLPKRGSGSGN